MTEKRGETPTTLLLKLPNRDSMNHVGKYWGLSDVMWRRDQLARTVVTARHVRPVSGFFSSTIPGRMAHMWVLEVTIISARKPHGREHPFYEGTRTIVDTGGGNCNPIVVARLSADPESVHPTPGSSSPWPGHPMTGYRQRHLTKLLSNRMSWLSGFQRLHLRQGVTSPHGAVFSFFVV